MKSLPMNSWTMKLTFCCLTLIACCEGRSADDFLDNVLVNLKNATNVRDLLDPLMIDDIKLKQFQFHNITIYNLLSLVRKGPAFTESQASRIVLSATLEVSSVVVHVAYLRQKRVLRLRGDIWTQIDRILFKLRVSANGFSLVLSSAAWGMNEYQIVLSASVALLDVKVVDLGQIRILRVSGVTPVLNKLAEVVLQKLLLDRNRDKLREAIEQQGQQALEAALKKADLSLFSF